jgi:hypothetical protein
MKTHAHLEEAHAGKVEMRRHGETEFSFVLRCPECGSEAERRINPRGREPGFLDEFSREIRLVAFDMLLYHLQADHPEAVGAPSHPAATPNESAGSGKEQNDANGVSEQ